MPPPHFQSTHHGSATATARCPHDDQFRVGHRQYTTGRGVRAGRPRVAESESARAARRKKGASDVILYTDMKVGRFFLKSWFWSAVAIVDWSIFWFLSVSIVRFRAVVCERSVSEGHMYALALVPRG